MKLGPVAVESIRRSTSYKEAIIKIIAQNGIPKTKAEQIVIVNCCLTMLALISQYEAEGCE